MGLKEKKVIKEFQDNNLPGIKKQVEEIIGTSPEWEIDWDSLVEGDYGDKYLETWPKIYFTPIIESFKSICVDSLGKDVLASGLKKIIIKNEKKVFYPEHWEYKNGVLVIDHEPASNSDKVEERIRVLTNILENSL